MRILRKVVRGVFWLAAAGFLVLFLLQYAPASVQALEPAAWLRRLGSPIVRQVGAWLGIAAGSSLLKHVPLVLAVAAFALKTAVDRVLLKVLPVVSLPRAEAPTPPMPAPAPAPTAARGSGPFERPAGTALPSRGGGSFEKPAAPAPPPRETPRASVVRSSGRVEPPPASRVVEKPPAAAGAGDVSAEATLAGQVIETGVPKRISRYEVLQELGRGAMGAVYKARDPHLGRAVAIKVILTANLTPQALAEYKKRFYREAEAAGQMTHPSIVTTHDVSEDPASGQPFLVMEFIEGMTLEHMIEETEQGLPLEQALDIGVQVAEALGYAHERGVIHRDIKPANIMVTRDGRAKITDFGIAKMEGAQLTQTGQLVGTPAFMSPEQFSGGGVDARSDIFSLGAVLYETLTGKMPFPGDTVTEIIFKVTQSPPVPLRQVNPALPAEIETVLSRCLAKDPAGRYQKVRQLAADLEAVKAGRPLQESDQWPATRDQ